MKKIKYLIVVFLLLIITACSTKKENKTYDNPIVSMEIENYGTIEIELYPEYAPNTVANFVNLIEEGFYNRNSFHRLMPGFVLQGGDPEGTGFGGPGYTIKGEFKQNNYAKNTLSHTKGVISMARNNVSMDSAGSQFFIVLSDNAKYSLDNMYAGFGKVTKGMEILEEIESKEEVADSDSGKLKENITITKVTVDTKGASYKVKKITN